VFSPPSARSSADAAQIVLDKAVALRQALKDAAHKQGLVLTLMPLLIKAASIALARFPVVNGSLAADGASIIFKVRPVGMREGRVTDERRALTTSALQSTPQAVSLCPTSRVFRP
jgi:pyruvate/2-oxoglutarate dehydrogenase complex dihydrolipoamide acyltransferase (E2) component